MHEQTLLLYWKILATVFTKLSSWKRWQININTRGPASNLMHGFSHSHNDTWLRHWKHSLCLVPNEQYSCWSTDIVSTAQAVPGELAAQFKITPEMRACDERQNCCPCFLLLALNYHSTSALLLPEKKKSQKETLTHWRTEDRSSFVKLCFQPHQRAI